MKETGFFVFQEPSSHLNPLLPLGVQIREGSLSHSSDEATLLGELWEGTDAAEIQKLLSVYPKPYRPSGGEKQRMFLVMALKKIDMSPGRQRREPPFFVFDEPTGSLDNHFRDVFLRLLFARFQRCGFTALVITHDYSMINQVTRSHRDSLPSVSFKELRRHRGQLEVKDFLTETYTGWLKEQEASTRRFSPVAKGPPLLTVESGIGVFGRQITFSRDPAGKNAFPLEVLPGTMVYLKAPSGEGKTTVMKILMGLVRAEHLRMSLTGTDLTERSPRRFWQRRVWGRHMTMVFQHADEALNPRSRVKDIFRGLPTREKMTPAVIRQKLRDLFDVELDDDFHDTRVSLLSGGQKQRLNLLRGLTLDTKILLLDEPLNGLDFDSTTRVLSLLEEKQRSGSGILLVSHNEEIVSAVVPRDNMYYMHSRMVATSAGS
jgi:peptide/nickel transport system ATP-binding protein